MVNRSRFQLLIIFCKLNGKRIEKEMRESHYRVNTEGPKENGYQTR